MLNSFTTQVYDSWCNLKTPSTSTITYAPVSSISYDKTWNSWYEWQKTQPTIHFQRSEIFRKYANYNDIPPINFTDDYIYVLGDFRYFITFEYIRNESIFWEFIEILINLYDTCKGIRRSILGDSSFIIMLKNSFKSKNCKDIYNYDYKECDYDYQKIHVHTVAHFSLSTLIMRFVSQLLCMKLGMNSKYPTMNNLSFVDFYKKDCYKYLKKTHAETSMINVIPSLPKISYPKEIKRRKEYIFEPKSEPQIYINDLLMNQSVEDRYSQRELIDKLQEQIDFYNHCDEL